MLAKQTIDISLFKSLETKTDPKLSQGNLVLENCTFDSHGQLVKRHGYNTLSQSLFLPHNPDIETTGSQFTKGYSVYSDNGTLGVWARTYVSGVQGAFGDGFYEYNPRQEQWTLQDYRRPIEFTIDRLTGPSHALTKTAHAVDPNGRTLVAWIENNLMHCSIFDANGSPLVERKKIVSALYVQFRVYAMDDHWVIVHSAISNRISFITVDYDNFTTQTTFILDQLYQGALSGPRIWDSVQLSNKKLAIAYRGPNINHVALVNQTGTVETSISGTDVAKSCIGVFLDEEENVWTTYDSGSFNHIRTTAYDSTLTNTVKPQASVMVLSASINEVINIGGVYDPGRKTTVIVGSIASPKAACTGTFVTEIPLTGSALGKDLIAWGPEIYSKPFLFNDEAHWLSIYKDDTHQSYFLHGIKDFKDISNFGTPDVTRFLVADGLILKNKAGQDSIYMEAITTSAQPGMRYQDLLQPVAVSGTIEIPIYVSDGPKSELTVDSTEWDTQPTSIGLLTISEHKPSKALAGKDVLYTGGMVCTPRAELGFHIDPPLIENWAEVSTSGGSLGPGKFGLVACYEWRDHKGQLHRSGISPLLQAEITGSSKAIQVSTRINTLVDWYSKYDKLGFNTTIITPHSVVIAFYRTTANGSVFHQCGQLRNALAYGDSFNVETSSGKTITITLQADDNNLLDNEFLYIEGGIIENTSPPAAKSMCVSEDRLWVVPMDEPTTLWYSKQKVNGEGWAFSDILQTQLVTENQPIVAIVPTQQGLAALTKESVYYVGGQPLDNLGQGQGLQSLKVSTGIGCNNPKSVLSYHQGVAFQSAKGIYSFVQGSSIQYIGAPVDSFKDQLVAGVVESADQNALIFGLETSGSLHWDYAVNQWSYHTIGEVKDLCTHDGKLTWITPSGAVRQQDETHYWDFQSGSVSAVQMKTRTPWIKVAGLSGVERIYWATILGEYRSPHTLNINVYQNYSNTPSQTITVDSSDLGLTTEGEPMHVRFRIKFQKCNSISFEIFDTNQSGTAESFRLTSMTLEVGVKRGLKGSIPKSLTL